MWQHRASSLPGRQIHHVANHAYSYGPIKLWSYIVMALSCRQSCIRLHSHTPTWHHITHPIPVMSPCCITILSVSQTAIRFACACVCVHAHTPAHLCANAQTCMCACVHVCVSACVPVWLPVRTRARVIVHMPLTHVHYQCQYFCAQHCTAAQYCTRSLALQLQLQLQLQL